MEMDRNDLREDILATLAANRELDGTADEELVAGLLERIARQTPQRSRHGDLRAAFNSLIPMKPTTIASIAVAQGAVLFVLGETLLHRIFEFYYASGDQGHSLMVLGLIWIVEVIVTIAVISALAPREERRQPARRRGPASLP